MPLVLPYFFTQMSESISWKERANVSDLRIFILNDSHSEIGITLAGRTDYLWVRHDAEMRLVITIQANDTAKISKALNWMKDQFVQKEEVIIEL